MIAKQSLSELVACHSSIEFEAQELLEACRLQNTVTFTRQQSVPSMEIESRMFSITSRAGYDRTSCPSMTTTKNASRSTTHSPLTAHRHDATAVKERVVLKPKTTRERSPLIEHGKKARSTGHENVVVAFEFPYARLRTIFNWTEVK